jgi:hypothetical protein
MAGLFLMFLWLNFSFSEVQISPQKSDLPDVLENNQQTLADLLCE